MTGKDAGFVAFIVGMAIVAAVGVRQAYDNGVEHGKREQCEASHHQFYIDHGAGKALPPCFIDNPEGGITVLTKPEPDSTKPVITKPLDRPLKPGDAVKLEPSLLGRTGADLVFSDYVEAETADSQKQRAYVECWREDKLVRCKVWIAPWVSR